MGNVGSSKETDGPSVKAMSSHYAHRPMPPQTGNLQIPIVCLSQLFPFRGKISTTWSSTLSTPDLYIRLVDPAWARDNDKLDLPILCVRFSSAHDHSHCQWSAAVSLMNAEVLPKLEWKEEPEEHDLPKVILGIMEATIHLHESESGIVNAVKSRLPWFSGHGQGRSWFYDHLMKLRLAAMLYQLLPWEDNSERKFRRSQISHGDGRKFSWCSPLSYVDIARTRGISLSWTNQSGSILMPAQLAQRGVFSSELLERLRGLETSPPAMLRLSPAEFHPQYAPITKDHTVPTSDHELTAQPTSGTSTDFVSSPSSSWELTSGQLHTLA